MTFERLAVLHAAPTLAMVGVIWIVQVVHYPLFAGVGARGFADYAEAHGRRITWIVLPLMVAEVAANAALCLRAEEADDRALAWFGAGLLALLWISTFLVQVPCHDRLRRGFDATAWRRLVRTNWLRTAGWTLRGAIAIALLWR